MNTNKNDWIAYDGSVVYLDKTESLILELVLDLDINVLDKCRLLMHYKSVMQPAAFKYMAEITETVELLKAYYHD